MSSELASMDKPIVETPGEHTALPAQEPSVNAALKDIVFGSTAGMIGKVFEYPFDTVKVRLQSQDHTVPLRYKGPIDCLVQGLKADGLRGLYRGISSPMVGAAVENSSLFFSYNLSQGIVRKAFYSSLDKTTTLPMEALLFCGAASGAFTSMFLTPIELVKCKMQVQAINPVGDATLKTYKHPGPFQLIGQIYKAYGIKGFFHGGTGTFFRETGGSAAWFGSYEYATASLKAYRGTVKSSSTDQMLAGAAAGVSYNFFFFPADSIKSKMQTAVIGKAGEASPGFWAVGKAMYQAGGIQGLYRGCGITCARSAPSSALIFLCYETLKEWFS